MYDNRIEITSPGGLPKGISKEEYLNGGISIPRNYILCNVFLRLHMIERFGTGIKRINQYYKDNAIKPQYVITENMIKICLPIIEKNTLEEKINTAKKHLKLAVEEHGEYVAVREMRKHIAWYLKGLRNSARVRDEINKIESYEEVVNKLESYMQDCLTLE